MKLQLIQRENKCPDCIYMEIESDTVDYPQKHLKRLLSRITRTQGKKEKHLKLLLSIHFNEHWELLPGGMVKFGLRRGELRLRLEGSRIPLNSRELGVLLTTDIPTERQCQSGKEGQDGLTASINDRKLEIKVNAETKQTSAISDSFRFINNQISIKGDETNPAWVFEVKTGEPILKGILKSAILGTLDVIEQPCSVKATFEASLMKDSYVTDAQGIYPPNISKKPRAMIERALVKHLLKKKFGEILSQAEFTILELSQESVKQGI